MKKILFPVVLCLLTSAALKAQITITAADMPVNGDTLRSSIALPDAGFDLGNTGANITWNYSTLIPLAQTVDTYKTAAAAGYSGGGIPAASFGYKVADSLPGAPIPVTNVYTFFNVKPATSPTRFVAEGFGAKVNAILPIPGGYSNEDTIYNFPLTFNRLDSSTYNLTIDVALLGARLKQQGKRKTVVDGWGTIQTPYFTTPVAVLRVRSEVTEIDSITFGGNTIPLPRHYAEYKWLAKGEHAPVLMVNANIVGTTETPTSVRYRDSKRDFVGVTGPSAAIESLLVYPNPATGAEVTVKIPAAWNHYVLHVYDITGKLLSEVSDTPKVSTATLPSGKYMVVVEGNSIYGIAQFVK